MNVGRIFVAAFPFTGRTMAWDQTAQFCPRSRDVLSLDGAFHERTLGGQLIPSCQNVSMTKVHCGDSGFVFPQ